MGLPSWAYAGAGGGEWEDRGIFLRNRKTGEVRPKGIAGGLPAISPRSGSSAHPGGLEAGNIDLRKRPEHRNQDGTVSTVRSISIGTDQGEVLIPTISDDGRSLSDEEAIALYRRTGRHLGVFDSPEDATAYARALHGNQARLLAKREELRRIGREGDIGKVETPDTSALSVAKEALGLAGATAVNQNVTTARLPSIALQGVAEMGQRVEDTLNPEARRERADAYAGLALDTSPSAGLVRESIESQRAARDLKLDPLAPAAAMTQGWEEAARGRLADATSKMPTLAAVGVHQLATMAGMAVDPTIGGGGKGVARELTEGVAQATPKRISSLASRVLPGEDISERFSSFLRARGIEDPDLYHDLSEAAQKALDREFLAADAGPQGASWRRFLDQQGLRGDDYASLPGVERARLEGEFRRLSPKTRQAAPGATISPGPEAIPVPELDRAAGGVAARSRINPEAGFIRLGPGGAEPPPDPVLAGFHSEVFGREAKATAGEKLGALGERLQREMVEAYTPLLKVARRFGPAAEDEIEVAIQRTRSASHTQMNPVLRFTEEYDPLANGGRGDWVKTGKPLTEEVTAKLSSSERVEVESILAAGSQVEFAGRKEAALAQRMADRAANAAERNMLRLLGQEQRRELRGLSYEARALRAEELAATARGQRTLGRLDVLNRVSREGRRAGMDLPQTSARQEAQAWVAGQEAEWAAADAAGTERALRRGIGDLSREELRRYRERLAIVRPPDIPDLRLEIDPVRTLQAREVMRHAEETGLLKKYEEVLGQASIDRSSPGTGYRGWADRAWLRPAVGAGFITEGDRVAMLQKNQMYSLFQQIDTLARQKGVDLAAGEVPNAPRFLKNAPPSVIHGVRKSPLETRMAGLQEGQQIAPVLEASAIQAARFQRLVDRQLVKNKLADLVELNPELAPEIVKTTDPMAPGSFVAFKGGEKAYLQAPPDLLENLDRLTAKQAAFVLEAAQRATGALRVAATTYTPGFPFGNLARDTQRGWITSQHGMLPGEPLYTMGKEIVHRLFHRFEPSAMWREFDEGVASYSTFVKADSDGVNRAMQEAAQAVSGSPSARRIVDLVNPIAWLRELGQFKEAATRVTEKALARRGGRSWFRGQANPAHLDPETGAVRPRTRTESDLDAGKVSLNFMSGGSATREANRYYAFLNAQALDAADFFRQVTGPRKFTVIAKATAAVTLPALYEVWHFRNDPEYRNLPWWDRSMFWHLGKMGDEIPQGSRVMADGYIRTPTGEVLPPRSFWDGTWRRIPRPPGLFNLVFGILPSLAFGAVLDSNPKAGEEAVAGLVEQTPMQFLLDYDEPSGDLNANLFPMVPDALRPPLEAGTNLKGFPFGQAIDPRGTEEADPALRWNEQTPLWARSLSERSAPGAYHGAVSPNRIQRVVEGYGAGAAKAAGGIVDRALLAGGQDPNGDPYADTQDPLTPRDVPFLRSFMGSPAQGPGSAPVKEFWARYDTARQSMDVLEGWEKAGRLDQARKALDAHPELRYKSDLESTAKRLREMGKERKEILAAPFHVLGPEQKRAYLELVDQGMTQVAGQLLLYIQQQELARQGK